uniref:One cut homeobox 1 n=1 Tax=Rhinopithecus bieti TaxID=61621 RepID=A0A2K6MGS3_RHIBE
MESQKSFIKHVKGKNKNMGKIEATHPKSPGWSSQMSSVELYMQYSRKISVHPKNCKSPFPSSWGWS